jgi:FkbM family methyltransferase
MLIDIFQLKFINVVNGIIHIGAHDCEERIKYLSRFNEVTDDDIIWIDALKHKVEEIQGKNSSIRIYNECIGNNDDESVIFKVTNNFQSSSFLSLKEHLIEHPDIYEITQIEMKTKTLKTFYDENNLKYDKYNFMALDIQGAELLALKGAAEILNTVDYIYIEVNTKELYESCALLPEIDEYLSTFGFSRDNILMTEHGWGDAFYTKHIHNLINPIKITYGTDYSNIDVTNITMQKCIQNNIIHIPNDDQERNILFGDPLYGVKKYIFITSCNITYTIDYYDYVNIDIKNNKLYINEVVPIPPVKEYKILKYQYNFAIMAIFKNETMVLKTWLEHYIWQGVDHFYLIDNGSTDEPLTILQSYIDKGLVTYYYKPERFCQTQHYRYIFDSENLKYCCKWLCICDLDEFFFGTEQPLAKELDNFDNYYVINTHSFFYGSDGLIDQPEDIRTAIVHRTDDIINGNKYIFKPCSVKDSSEVWIHWLVEPGTYQKKNGINSTDNDTKIRLNHYVVQSLEYFQEVKMTRGDVSTAQNENVRTMEIFNYYTNVATIKDDILKRIIETNYDYTKIFVYGDSHGKFNFNNFEKTLNTDNSIIFNDRHQSNITMFRIARDKCIINFNNNEHDKNSILCFNYGEIDCRCHIQKQINLGRNEDDIINDLVSKYFISIHENVKQNKKIVIIAIIPSTHQYDYEKNYGPITHKHPFIGTDENRIRYTKKMNETIKSFCLKYNYYYFDPFLYYTREDGSLKHELSDNMVHLGNNEHFLKKFWIDIIMETTIIHLQYNCDGGQKDEPDFSIENMDYKIYKQENVINYKYEHLSPGITIHKFENIKPSNDAEVYIILDCPGADAFAHWVFETFIFFPLFEKINKLYSNVKILTNNNKKYVANLLKFIGMNNEIVYKIDNHDNICFILPLLSLNQILDENIFKWGIRNFINTVEQNTITVKNKTNILFLPRNTKDNFGHNGLFPDRLDLNEVNYISDGVIKNGGSILNTYEINDFFYQFSIIRNSKNIILDYGSSFLVNGIVCKDQNIIVLNKHWKSDNHFIFNSLNILYNIKLDSNNIIILNEYECYEDISKHFI